MPRSLFRKEAIDAQREKFLGEASIAQPVQLWVYTTVACIVAAVVVAVAIWGQYTRRERVQGILSSAVGAASIRMPDAGVVSELLVKEGDVVAKGATLARLSIDRSGIGGEDNARALLAQLELKLASLRTQEQQVDLLGQQMLQQARQNVVGLRNEVEQMKDQAVLQEARWRSQEEIAAKWKGLEGDQFISPIRVQQEQDKARDERIKLQELKRSLSALTSRLTEATNAVASTETRSRSQLEQVRQQINGTEHDLAKARGDIELLKREMLIVAPIDGTITNIGPARGQTVSADAPLATLLPKDSPLHAELLVPTRAIGFVTPGQEVNLRYEAFPYERFGQYHGKVETIGRTILMQGDALGQLPIREPAYRIVVDLDRQTISSGATQLPLRAGMAVSADLLMEKRSLVEWLFQPVLQLRERIASRDPA